MTGWNSSTKRGFVSTASVLLTLVCAACAVTTPRDGFTTVAGGPGQRSVTGTQDDTGLLPGDAAIAGSGDTGGAGDGTAAGSAFSGGSGTASGGGGAGGGGGSSATTALRGGSGATTAGGTTVGVTKDTITISTLYGVTGTYGAILTKTYDNGFGTWLDEINERGGIHGRRVVAKKVDNKDTEEGGVAACKEIQTNGSFMAVHIVGFGGADIASIDCLDRAGIPTLALNLSGFKKTWKNSWSAGDKAKQTKTLATFIANVIGDKGKIGIIYANDQLNVAGRDGLVAEMRRIGTNLVHQEPVAPNQGSFVAELNRMRGAGATTVALVVNSNEVVGILRDARAINYAPNWTGDYWVLDESTSAARSLYEGIKAVRNYAATNSQAFAEYSAKAKKYGRDDVVNSTTMAFYGIALLTGAVLQNAGAAPTREALPHAIESLVNYNNGVTMALSFGPGNHVAEVGMWPIQCCNPDNTWMGIGDAKTHF